MLNHRLIDAIRTSQQTFSARLFPVDIHIDNTSSPDWTVVDITADDTPAFLYSLSNALAMRNVYIHRVTIRSDQGKVLDRLYVVVIVVAKSPQRLDNASCGSSSL